MFVVREVGKDRKTPADRNRCSVSLGELKQCDGLVWRRYHHETKVLVEEVVMTKETAIAHYDYKNNKVILPTGQDNGEGYVRLSIS